MIFTCWCILESLQDQHFISFRGDLYGAPSSLLAFTLALFFFFFFVFFIFAKRACQVQHEECWEISHQINRRQFAVQNDKRGETFCGGIRDFLRSVCTCAGRLKVSMPLVSICSQRCMSASFHQNSHRANPSNTIILAREAHDAPRLSKTTVCRLTTLSSFSCHF